MKRVYFATPVTSRGEASLQQRREAALARCVEMRELLKRQHPDWMIVHPFMVCPVREQMSEAEAMGRCVTLLMSCDILVLDYNYGISRGCRVENAVAKAYGLDRKHVWQKLKGNIIELVKLYDYE